MNSTNSINQSTEYYDHHTDTRYILRSKIHNRIPSPGSHTPRSVTPRRSTNEYDDDDEFTLVKSKRRRNQNNIKHNYHYDLVQDIQPNVVDTHSTTTHQVQQMFQPIVPTVSIEATRYAQTRFPFSPFIIRFNSGNIKESHAAEQITKHFYDIVKIDVNIVNSRKSTVKCQGDDSDLLIYVKDVDSFSALFVKQYWPQQIGEQAFTFPSMPSFPPPLSMIMKNVDLIVDLNELCAELNSLYPEIHNIIRLKNKYQNDIKMMKIEILSSSKRDALLKDESKKTDGYLLAKVEELMMNNKEVKDKSDSNEKLIKKLILPSLDLLSHFLQHINLKATGIDNTDFKYKIQTVRAQLDNALKGKIFS
ncbi:unnamed protein product [Rotaria sp. Silwood1]|nr:unnamed protein product [Rotaria sp. Silwood1]